MRIRSCSFTLPAVAVSLVLLALALPTNPNPLPTHTRVGMCAYVGNEGPLLVEWLEYHQLLGVHRYYLYVASEDADTRELLRRAYTAEELQELSERRSNRTALSAAKERAHIQQSPALRILLLNQPALTVEENAQAKAMDHCAQTFGRANDWLLFVDVDEFVMFDPKVRLPARLRQLHVSLRQRHPSLGDLLDGYGAEVDGVLLQERLFVPQGIHTGRRSRTRSPVSLLTEAVRHWRPRPQSQVKLALHTARGARVLDACSFLNSRNNASYVHNCLANGEQPEHTRHRSMSDNGTTADDRNRVDLLSVTAISAAEGRSTQDSWFASQPSRAAPLFIHHYFSRTCYEWAHELIPKRARHIWYRLSDPHAREVVRKIGEGLLDPAVAADLSAPNDQMFHSFRSRLDPRTCQHLARNSKAEPITRDSRMGRMLPSLRSAFTARMRRAER